MLFIFLLGLGLRGGHWWLVSKASVGVHGIVDLMELLNKWCFFFCLLGWGLGIGGWFGNGILLNKCPLGKKDVHEKLLNSFKLYQMLANRLFPQARYSIWVDSKSQLRRDPLGVFEALLWHANSVLALSEHGARSSVYDEAKAVVKKHKATPEEVEVQMTQYRHDGFPDDKRFNGKKGISLISYFLLWCFLFAFKKLMY